MRLLGLCVSKGNAKGHVRIITNNCSVNNNHYSVPTILVLEKLDRKFLVNLDENVVGVIAEEGNIGSHGAGILRQLNIPCVLRINNATKIMVDNSIATIYGQGAYVDCQTRKAEFNVSSTTICGHAGLSYSEISKEVFNIKDIRPIQNWICPRPDRIYQELRYCIIKDVFANSGHFLFGLPEAQVKRNDYGAILVYGLPRIDDVCSFLLCNPSWLVKKAKERSVEFERIKCELNEIEAGLDSTNLQSIYIVFNKCTILYKSLFKYAFTSQAISDELLDLYIDFCKSIGIETTKGLLKIKSDYVEKCLKTGIDPGVSQRWSSNRAIPHIWDGSIDYTPMEIEDTIQSAIESRPNYETLSRDYDAFRIIVPLVYQLSEEYFYISSSINSFINWAITKICFLINQKIGENSSVVSYYDMSLEKFCKLIEYQLKGGEKMNNYSFMDVFHPNSTLIKEFDYWLVLLREGQVTLGDCLIVLKREVPSFGDMTEHESEELSKVLRWYENKCKSVFGAIKFNYIAAMMRDNFVHFHTFPRYNKTVEKYGIEWKDERWPRVIQFGESQCDSTVFQSIMNDLAD